MLLKEIVSPSGKRKLRLHERSDRHCWFEEIYEAYDEYAGVYWAIEYESGIFADANLAEVEMIAVTPWLRDQPQL